MKIKEFSIDRYGACSNFRLDELQEGLNVVYGVHGSEKTSLIRFLQAMLYGFPAGEEGWAGRNTLWGGTLTVDGPYGRCTIRRHDDGTRTGRLSLDAEHRAVIDHHLLAELLCGVDESAFRVVFSVALGESAATGDLVRTALKHGFELEELRAERPAYFGRDEAATRHEIVTLRERRQVAETEIEEIERNRLRLLERRQDEERRMAEEIDHCQTELHRLRHELESVDEEIATWEAPTLSRRVDSFSQPSTPDRATLKHRLHAVCEQMKRWRKVRHEVLRRRTRLRREMQSWTNDLAHPSAVLCGGAQKHLDSIEQRLQQLQREIQLLTEPAENRKTQEAALRSLPLVPALRDEVYQLCRELNRHHLEERREAITEELRQLRRCHGVVAWRLQRLAARRRSIERELEAERAALAPLRRRRHEIAEQIRLGEARLRTLSDKRRALELHATEEQLARGEKRRRELDGILRELDHRLARLTAVSIDPPRRGEINSTAPVVAHEASEFLRRLTDGEFVRIHVARHDSRVRIEDIEGELFFLEGPDRLVPERGELRDAARTVGPSVRDRVHLALCLALVEAYARRGVHLPLFLDDAFGRLNPVQSERLGEILREFAARGRQVFVFTSQEQIARMFRHMDVSVVELLREWRSPEHRPEPAQVPEVLPAACTPASCEPREKGYFRRSYLRRSDALEYAPDLDPAAARELSFEAIATVGDFLALSPLAVEQKLSRLHVPAETIRRWQAVARLMCDTPNLRAYDARILAASGVATADELERLAPEELLDRVARCLETDHGRTLFRQGDDDELARLASWIGAGRTTQTLRETQKRHGWKQSA